MNALSVGCRQPRPYLPAIGGVAILLALLGGFQPNLFLAILAFVILAIGFKLLWRPGETPILLYIFFFQWLQASLKIFHSNVMGVNIDELSFFSANNYLATALSLAGLVFLALGLRWGAGRWSPEFGRIEHKIVTGHSTHKLFISYFTALLISLLLQSLAWGVPGLTQPLLALAYLKWAFFFMLTFSTYVNKRATASYWLLAFLIELLLGFGGFFSDFKTVIIFSVFGLYAAGVTFSRGRLIGLSVLVVLMLSLNLLWSAVKVEYRAFVNQGSSSQVVSVGYVDAMGKLVELASRLDAKMIDFASLALLHRISYVDYFGAVLLRVPSTRPHENGGLWLDAITRPLMPRLLFEDKAIIDDSERTNIYTGLSVSGLEEGTSISIGYMGESYIDFGYVGMMVPLIVFGYLLGRVYRWLITLPYARGGLGMGLASCVLISAAQLESSITKVFGGLVISVLAAWIAAKLLRPWLVRMTRDSAAAVRRSSIPMK